MKPLRIRLQEARKRTGLVWEIHERDYLLSWILAGIAQVDILSKTLVFKGGTALKKCYFGNYRFSEDLDFSAVSGVPRGEAMEEAMREACSIAKGLLDPYAPVEITCARYREKNEHPGNQEAFDIRARFQWQHEPLTHVIVEIAVNEPILLPYKERSILHGYEEPLDAQILVYSLEEVLSEKLRAILQKVKVFEKRGWVRSRARDYYDLWRILGEWRDRLQLTDFISLLKKKCDLKEVGFVGPADFFHDKMLGEIERTWKQWLGPLTSPLPPFEKVIDDLRPKVEALFHEQQA